MRYRNMSGKLGMKLAISYYYSSIFKIRSKIKVMYFKYLIVFHNFACS